MALYAGKSVSIVLKTIPFIILRVLVYILFALLFIFYLSILFLIGQAVAGIHEYARVAVWIIGLLASFPLVRLVQEYILYIVKASHIAVITELAIKGALPQGVSQIAWGREQVQKRFKQASILFLADKLVAGVIGAVNRMMWRVENLFGALPGVGIVIKFANIVLHFSLTYVDESILARNFLKTDESLWQSAKTGVVLYVQIWKDILKASLTISIVSILTFPLLFLIFFLPAIGLGHAIPLMKLPFIVGAFFLAFAIKAALFDPWALTMMIINYLHLTEGKQPDPEWEEKIEKVSSKFRKLKEKTLSASV